MKEEKEEELAPAPYNDASFYLKTCRNCPRVVLLDKTVCPECGCTEFDIIDMVGGE